MQSSLRLYSFVIVCSVIGFHKGFLRFLLGGFSSMDSVACLRHVVTLDYELGFGLFLFASFRQILKGTLLRLLEFEEDKDPPLAMNKELSDECDPSILRKMVKEERERAEAAMADLEKERLASSTAAEEAMAMILKLQNEMSLIEIESKQFKRLAEEKQIHDQQVIQSLQWLVLRHEAEMDMLEHKLRFYQTRSKNYHECGDGKGEVEEDKEEGASCFNGNIMEALENVLYSSRDASVSCASASVVPTLYTILLHDVAITY